jgi:hypothetical protein
MQLGTGDYPAAADTVRVLLGYRVDDIWWQATLRAQLVLAEGMQSGDYANAILNAVDALSTTGHDVGAQLGTNIALLNPTTQIYQELRDTISTLTESHPEHSETWAAVTHVLNHDLEEPAI